jgi:hypothetical protein
VTYETKINIIKIDFALLCYLTGVFFFVKHLAS